MAKVKVIKRFNDVKARPNKIREVGDTFDASEERAKHLVGQGMVETIKETGKGTEKTEQKKEG